MAFVRYADDVIIHCRSEAETKEVLAAVRVRLAECKLRLNEEKTKVVYCQDYRRAKRKEFINKFDFLGFSFKPQSIPSNKGGLFLSFGCSISQTAQTKILTGWKQQNWQRRSDITLQEIADYVNIRMRGIIRYYGKYRLWTLRDLIGHLEDRLTKWALNKYKKFKGSYKKAYRWINEMKVSYPGMFYHWTLF